MLSGKEEEAATIMDNRDIFDQSSSPNNDVLVICDHATNDLKFIKPTDRETGMLESNEGFDPGAADLACLISERLECISVYSSFSKTIIDPSVSLCSQDLVPCFYKQLDEDQLQEVTFNSDGYRLWERLSSFYLEYYKLLKETALFLEQPSLILSVHSHDPEVQQGASCDIQLYRPWIEGDDLLIDRVYNSLSQAEGINI